jgi:multiple sugar transport system substrate-binding protein
MSNLDPSTRGSNGRATSRRQFLKQGGSIIAGGSILGLAGCGGGSSSSSSTTATSSSSGFGQAPTKNVAIGMTSDLFPAFTQKGPKGQMAPFKRFEAQTGIKVKVVTQSGDTSTYFEQMRTQLQAGAAEVDAFAGDVSWPPQFGSQGWLVDLSSQFPPSARAAFLPASIDANVWNGKIYGVPFYWDDGYLFYRKDLLEKSGYSGPPQTWAELTEMSQKVMKDHNLKYGFTFTGANYEGGTVLGLEFMRTNGANPIDGNTIAVNSPQAVAGLKVQRGLVTSGVSPQAVAEYEEGTVEGPFLAGDSVFLRNWNYMFGIFPNPKMSKVHPSQVGVAAVPRASTAIAPVNVGGGWNIYINKYSKNQDAAWKLTQFMTSPAQQLYTLNTITYVPTLSSLINSPKVAKENPFSGPALARPEIFQTVAPAKNPYYADMSTAMSTQFQNNVLGKVTPEQAADTLQNQLEQIAKRASLTG